MKTKEARELGRRVARLVQAGEIAQAYALLSPVLTRRTPFAMLRHVGEAIGVGPLETANAFMDRVAAEKTMGGWIVIASVLKRQIESDLQDAFDHCRKYIAMADVWHAADGFGERVPGPALVKHFRQTLDLLESWRIDPNRWVRRAVGVGIHFWAKRSRGDGDKVPQTKSLLTFLEPMFEEREIDAVKGVGWALKTLGRHYPNLLAYWLQIQIVQKKRPCRAPMLRKALTYLSNDQKARATGREP